MKRCVKIMGQRINEGELVYLILKRISPEEFDKKIRPIYEKKLLSEPTITLTKNMIKTFKQLKCSLHIKGKSNFSFYNHTCPVAILNYDVPLLVEEIKRIGEELPF